MPTATVRAVAALSACMSIGAFIVTPAWSARPLSTDDAGVTAKGACQLDLFGVRARQTGDPASSAAFVQSNCGVWEGTALGVSLGRAWPGEGTETAGAVGGKTALGTATDEDSASYALSWGAGSRLSRSRAMRVDSLAAMLIASLPLPAGWTLHGNLGWTHARAQGLSSTCISLAAEHQSRRGWRLGFETFANDRDRPPWLQAGLSVPLGTSGWSANFSAGAQVGPSRARVLSIGTTFDF